MVLIHPSLKHLLDHLSEAVDNNWDGVALIDGMEGSGKSGLGMLSCYYVDRTFNIDRIVFTPDQFMEAVDKAKVGEAILWDEFVTGGMSTDFMSEIQKALVMKMTMIRRKRLFILWIMPYYFIVGRYFAVARSRFLLHAYTPDGIVRGTFKTWNYDRKRLMYFRGRKEFDYCIEPYSKGTFPDFFSTYPNVINEKLYDDKKEAATLAINNQETNPKMKKLMLGFANLVKLIRKRTSITPKEISQAAGYSRNWIYQITGDKENEQED